MKLTPAAAKKVCRIATTRGLLIKRIEGGIWHNPGFEARLDCIWDAKDWLRNDPEENNSLAVQFIDDELRRHDVFIITG